MRLIDKLKRDAMYFGKPYKNKEEKEEFDRIRKQTFARARRDSIEAEAMRQGRIDAGGPKSMVKGALSDMNRFCRNAAANMERNERRELEERKKLKPF